MCVYWAVRRPTPRPRFESSKRFAKRPALGRLAAALTLAVVLSLAPVLVRLAAALALAVVLSLARVLCPRGRRCRCRGRCALRCGRRVRRRRRPPPPPPSHENSAHRCCHPPMRQGHGFPLLRSF